MKNSFCTLFPRCYQNDLCFSTNTILLIWPLCRNLTITKPYQVIKLDDMWQLAHMGVNGLLMKRRIEYEIVVTTLQVIWDSLSIPDYLEAEIKQSSVTAWASFVCRDMSVRNLVSEAHESSWEGRCHISYGSISSSLSTPPPENFRMEIHVTDILTLRDLEAYSHNMWSAGFISNRKVWIAHFV